MSVEHSKQSKQQEQNKVLDRKNYNDVGRAKIPKRNRAEARITKYLFAVPGTRKGKGCGVYNSLLDTFRNCLAWFLLIALMNRLHIYTHLTSNNNSVKAVNHFTFRYIYKHFFSPL